MVIGTFVQAGPYVDVADICIKDEILLKAFGPERTRNCLSTTMQLFDPDPKDHGFANNYDKCIPRRCISLNLALSLAGTRCSFFTVRSLTVNIGELGLCTKAN